MRGANASKRNMRRFPPYNLVTCHVLLHWEKIISMRIPIPPYKHQTIALERSLSAASISPRDESQMARGNNPPGPVPSAAGVPPSVPRQSQRQMSPRPAVSRRGRARWVQCPGDTRATLPPPPPPRQSAPERAASSQPLTQLWLHGWSGVVTVAPARDGLTCCTAAAAADRRGCALITSIWSLWLLLYSFSIASVRLTSVLINEDGFQMMSLILSLSRHSTDTSLFYRLILLPFAYFAYCIFKGWRHISTFIEKAGSNSHFAFLYSVAICYAKAAFIEWVLMLISFANRIYSKYLHHLPGHCVPSPAKPSDRVLCTSDSGDARIRNPQF